MKSRPHGYRSRRPLFPSPSQSARNARLMGLHLCTSISAEERQSKRMLQARRHSGFTSPGGQQPSKRKAEQTQAKDEVERVGTVGIRVHKSNRPSTVGPAEEETPNAICRRGTGRVYVTRGTLALGRQHSAAVHRLLGGLHPAT